MDGEREILEIGSSFEVACKAAKDRHQSGATAIVVMEAMAFAHDPKHERDTIPNLCDPDACPSERNVM